MYLYHIKNFFLKIKQSRIKLLSLAIYDTDQAVSYVISPQHSSHAFTAINAYST